MTTHPAYDAVGAILSIHAMVNGVLIDAIDDIPEHRMTEQPGGIVNHPAWTLSHLNAYAGLLLSLLDDQSVPTVETELERFGYGTTPVPDRGAYATKQELVDRFNQRHARLAAVVAERHATCFPRRPPETFQQHAPTVGHLAVTLMVAHPAYHLGQLKQWRRAAGMV